MFIPCKYVSSNFWANTFWGYLIPAPQVTKGVQVSKGWPAPWEPTDKTQRVIRQVSIYKN